jgi:hypothetical protein
MYQPIRHISEVPADRDLRLAVLDGNNVHALVFPCRRRGQAWVNSNTGQLVEVTPTHWEEWLAETNQIGTRSQA